VAFQTDKAYYSPRSLVKNHVTITGAKGQPLTGTFSVAVTSDKRVTPNPPANIVSELLLTSDLREHIEKPVFYLQNRYQSDFALDLLMRPHQWGRYNMAELAQERFSQPTIPPELWPELSGNVKDLLGRPIENIEVTAVSLNGGFVNSTQTDKEGRFRLPIAEMPDSTLFIVSTEPSKGVIRTELILNRENFPKRTLFDVPSVQSFREQLSYHIEKVEQQDINEEEIPVRLLQRAVVTAEQKPLSASPFYTEADHSLSEGELGKIHASSIADLFVGRFAGINTVTQGGALSGISIRGSGNAPLVLIDGMPANMEVINLLNPRDITQIDILTSAGKTGIFGISGANGVIAIYTKIGTIHSEIAAKPFHIKSIMPLGYQKSKMFYAPKSDLRTTILWQPVVHINEHGEASFEFHTADEQTSYTVVIAGLADDGTIISYEGKRGHTDDL